MYVDADKKVRFANISPLNSFGVFSDDLTGNLNFFVRWYKEDEWSGNETYFVEVYDAKNVTKYRMLGFNGTLTQIDKVPHYFSQCPANVFYLEDEVESIIKLTDRDDIIYSDIIQYKGFYTYASAPTGKEENKDKPLNGDMVTSKYIFGYKTTFEVNGGKLNFTARIIVDLEAKNITLALTFTPSFNFKGHLRCRFNDNPVDGTITLEAGKKKEVGMIVSTF